MALITDVDYALQAIRLSALRYSDDSVTPRIISLDPSFALNPYVAASGLSDIDRWPEISRALDSPPPDYGYSSTDDDGGAARAGPSRRGSGGLQYTQTIMGAKSGGLGMRVAGRRTEGKITKDRRANSGTVSRDSLMMSPSKTPKGRLPEVDGFFSPTGRPRSDSAPARALLEPPSSKVEIGTSMITSGRGLGGDAGSQLGVLEQAMSLSELSTTEDGTDRDSKEGHGSSMLGTGIGTGTGLGGSALPSESIPGDTDGYGFGETLLDEVGINSDLDEDQGEDEDPAGAQRIEAERRKSALLTSQRSSYEGPPLEFHTQPVAPVAIRQSSLTADLHRHVPHLVSTSVSESEETQAPSNPFASLYTSVAAHPPHPSLSLNVYFPHSSHPTKPLVLNVRKDATVEEVTGYGLLRYWEEDRQPLLSEQESEQRWSTVGWGLRIVEDDGEVDEDFPPLDRDGQISRFSYGDFAIVEATDSQVKQNTAKAPLIQRRPSRVIVGAARARPSQQGRPSFRQQPSTTSIESASSIDLPLMSASSAMKGSVGLGSALSKPVLLRVRVAAGADVHFTTTISVPTDMYIADLTEVVVKKKHLANPSSDWVLCLGNLSLALPLDRTVASLETNTDLALVKRQWAVEHGLGIGDRRGGDPSASIFKRISEPIAGQRYGAALSDFSQIYMKYQVHRKIAIGRHERQLVLDGRYIHIDPPQTRTFFDSTKTTSFGIDCVHAIKLTGRAGGFKLTLMRARDHTLKRYEFDAENGKQASEIVSNIKAMMKQSQAERNSMMSPAQPVNPRRS